MIFVVRLDLGIEVVDRKFLDVVFDPCLWPITLLLSRFGVEIALKATPSIPPT